MRTTTAFLLPFHRARQFYRTESLHMPRRLWCSVQLLKKRGVMFTANSTPPQLTFCPNVTASSAATDQNTNTTQLHATTDGHQRCRATATAPAAARAPDFAAPQSVGRPARRGATISAPLSASCAASLAPAPVSKDPGSRFTCVEGNSCDNNDKDFFERTPSATEFNNCPTGCFYRQLYMFRVLTPIIRSWYSCNYSLYWY